MVSCYGSFAECWLLSGGSLAGVTDDALKERGLTLGEDTKIIGTVKEINIENLINLEPDYVILSSDIATHNQVSNKLNEMGIQNGRFNIDSFDDYDSMMKQFCAYNNRNDLYEENVISIQKLAELLAINPRRRFSIPNKGFSVWNLDEKHKITPDDFKSLGKATPFEGWEVYGKNCLVVHNGKVVYKC